MGADFSKCCANHADGQEVPFKIVRRHARHEEVWMESESNNLSNHSANSAYSQPYRSRECTHGSSTASESENQTADIQEIVDVSSPFLQAKYTSESMPLSLPRSIPRSSPANNTIQQRRRTISGGVQPAPASPTSTITAALPIAFPQAQQQQQQQQQQPNPSLTGAHPSVRRLRSPQQSNFLSPGSFDDGIASQKAQPMQAYIQQQKQQQLQHAGFMHRTSAMVNLAAVGANREVASSDFGTIESDDEAEDSDNQRFRQDSFMSRESSIGAGSLADEEDFNDNFEQELQPVRVSTPDPHGGHLRSVLLGEAPALPQLQLPKPVKKPLAMHKRRNNGSQQSLRSNGSQQRRNNRHAEPAPQSQNTWDLIAIESSPTNSRPGFPTEEVLRRKWATASLMCN